MMASHEQLIRVCRAICRRMGKDVELFDNDGPTDLAKRWRKRSPLSSGERVLFLLAWDVYSGGKPKVSIGDVVNRLDRSNIAFIGSLLVALSQGSAELDRWLAAQVPGCTARRPAAVRALSHEQLVRVCQVLTSAAGYADFWGERGPSPAAEQIRDELLSGDKGDCRPWEALLVRLAWDLWDGSGGVTTAETLDWLGSQACEAYFSGLRIHPGALLTALEAGPAEVDRWLESMGVANA